MHRPLERVFGIGAGLVALGLAAIGVVQYKTLPDLRASDREMARAATILEEINDAMAASWDEAGMAFAYALHGLPEYRRLHEQAAADRLAHQLRLRSMLAGDAKLIRSLDYLSGLLNEWSLQMDELMRGGRAQGVDRAVELMSSASLTRLREGLRQASRELIESERNSLKETRAESEGTWRRVRILIGWGLSIAGVSMTVCTVLLFAGIRKRQAIQRELLKEKYLLKTLLDHVPVGIFFQDKELRFTRVSRAMATLVGLESPARMEGRKAEELVPEAEAQQQEARSLEVLRTGRVVHGVEHHLTWEGGPDAWVLASVLPLYDDRHEPMGLLGVTMDITERKRAEMAREESASRLAEWAEQLEQRNQHEKLLAELTELLQTSGDETEAGAIVGRYMPALYPGASGHLSLTKSSRNVVESVAVWGDSEGQVLVFAPEQCWALRRGRPHDAGVGRLEPRCGEGCNHHAAHCWCIPMMAHGESLGVFHLSSADSLTEEQRKSAVVTAERLGLALANLRLRNALQTLSIRDPLTGLFNRRYMEESCEREFRRASRHERPLAVLMADLDFFKRFNDTFGHAAGDALLREFGSLLQANTRKEDISCRYGGEEFLLLLPELTGEAALQCAEKVRKAVAQLAVHFNGQAMGKVTASIGVAAFPQHGGSMAALIRAADEALYAAKKLGRDRVVLASTLADEIEP